MDEHCCATLRRRSWKQSWGWRAGQLGLPAEVGSPRTVTQLDALEALQAGAAHLHTHQPPGLEAFQFCSANPLEPSPITLSLGHT